MYSSTKSLCTIAIFGIPDGKLPVTARCGWQFSSVWKLLLLCWTWQMGLQFFRSSPYEDWPWPPKSRDGWGKGKTFPFRANLFLKPNDFFYLYQLKASIYVEHPTDKARLYIDHLAIVDDMILLIVSVRNDKVCPFKYCGMDCLTKIWTHNLESRFRTVIRMRWQCNEMLKGRRRGKFSSATYF